MHHSYIDRFAQGDSLIHRLDPRVKLIGVLAYTAVLISFDRHDVAALAPMLVMPLAMLWLGGVPISFALRRVAVLSPFIAMVCLLSPLYDRIPQPVSVGPWHFVIARGWLAAANIAAKFALGLMALTAMMSTTPFASLLEGMRKLGAPRMLAAQLGFVYRYLFVLMDEAMRVRRGRDFRCAALAPASRRLAAAGGIIGSLFLRTLERSERVHIAMCARGYRGEPRGLSRLRLRSADAAFLVLTAAYLLLCRWAYPSIVG